MTPSRTAVRVAMLVTLSLNVAQAEVRSRSIGEELTGEARTEFEQGKELFEHEDYVTAHAKLQRAYDISRNVRILWNLAACSAKQKRYALAIAEVDRYLLEGAGKLSPEQTERARQFIVGLRGLVAEATFSVIPVGAKLSIDRVARGLLGSPVLVLLDLGEHTVQLEKDGFESLRTTIDVTQVGPSSYPFKLVETVKTGHLVVNSDLDALIEVDGKPTAKGAFDGNLPVGSHRIRISAPDRDAHEAIVEIHDGRTKDLTVTLVQTRRESAAWWHWAVGGAVAAAGLGVGGYLLFRPTDSVAGPIPGSIDTIWIRP